jgi:hypothetical protein
MPAQLLQVVDEGHFRTGIFIPLIEEIEQGHFGFYKGTKLGGWVWISLNSVILPSSCVSGMPNKITKPLQIPNPFNSSCVNPNMPIPNLTNSPVNLTSASAF